MPNDRVLLRELVSAVALSGQLAARLPACGRTDGDDLELEEAPRQLVFVCSATQKPRDACSLLLELDR